jgi:hypothetical protein
MSAIRFWRCFFVASSTTVSFAGFAQRKRDRQPRSPPTIDPLALAHAQPLRSPIHGVLPKSRRFRKALFYIHKLSKNHWVPFSRLPFHCCHPNERETASNSTVQEYSLKLSKNEKPAFRFAVSLSDSIDALEESVLLMHVAMHPGTVQ